MFEFLFKYPLDQFHIGTLELAVSGEIFIALVAVTAILVLWPLGYSGLARRLGNTQWHRPILLSLLRTGLLAIVLFSLLAPQLVVPVERHERGRVAILIDDSLSMRIADQAGSTRADYVMNAFAPGTGVVAREIETHFETEFFRFAGEVTPIRGGSELSFSEPSTDLAGALRQTFDEHSGEPLSAIIIVTDGADNSSSTMTDVLTRLRAAGVTVHAVGVGTEHFGKDLEISAVRIPREVFTGDTLQAEVEIRYRGLDEPTASLLVEDESLIIAEQELILPPGQNQIKARVEFELKEAGPHGLVFRLPVTEDEVITDNNEDRLIVNVQEERINVLHLEGEPRFEVKFTRRAVTDDENIRLVSLVRTSDNKLYRLGVEEPEELADGFPTTPEALFPFRVVILGSVEASQLDTNQQQLLIDFVSRRGGGLLLLGGRHAFAEGSYGESSLAALMPVVLDSRAAAFRSEVKIEPTHIGLRHAVLRTLDSDLWPRLPRLNMVNPIRRLKPGATLLLDGRNARNESLVVLASQRYGRGTVAAFPVRDTWRWQMHSRVPVDDRTHETLWRQLLRWLARPAAGRIQPHLTPQQGIVGQPVQIFVDVVDPAYRPLGGATVRLAIDNPIGDRTELELDWESSLAGRYQTQFTPTQSGRHDLHLSLISDDKVAATGTMYLHVSATGREYHRSELNAPLLQRIADETRGRYVAAIDDSNLTEAIATPQSGRLVTNRLPLWDAPAIYLFIVALACLEWFYRRRWRLK
ncbi:MAG: VWA domain-containing protein [Arenicellales bacterium]|nr:VWA domain-containing protein [Arenicellales bacterium]